MKMSVRVLLSSMMFLEFFIWGAWYVTVGNFMANAGMADKIAWAYSVIPIAAIISPFFLGMVADRFFASERVLGVMCILGAVAMAGAGLIGVKAFDLAGAQAVVPEGLKWAFIAMLMLHALCFAPTLGLTNTVAFHHVRNAQTDFPLLRVFGTIGWIVSGGWIISKWLQADVRPIQFFICAGSGLLLGVLSFFLPHTPPPAKGKSVTVRDILGLDALALLKDPAFLVFIVCSFLICIPLAMYYAFAAPYLKAVGVGDPAYVMSYGQVSEIFFMVVMPIFFRLLGVKWMILVGMGAWILRYGFFSAVAIVSGAGALPLAEANGALPAGVFPLLMGAVLLHGICYDFFFVTGQIYTDQKAPIKIRGQAQGFLVLVTQGLGLLIGAQIGGKLFQMIPGKGATITDWQHFWLLPCLAAAVIAVIFFSTFWEKKTSVSEAQKR